MIILTERNRLALAVMVLSCGLWLMIPAATLARETYVALAERLTTKPQDSASFRPDLEVTVLRLVNDYRRKAGKRPLKTSNTWQVAARAHAMDLALHNTMGHVSSTGAGFESRVRAFLKGAMFLPTMGENAARERSDGAPGNAKAARLVGQWIKSPAHRKAMVNSSFESVATGVVQMGDQLYAVQIFSGPAVKTNVSKAGATSSVEVY